MTPHHSATNQESKDQRQKIIFVVGPTAVGKSAAAFELARKLNGEIVSCDAMQVYKEMHIASDKPSDDMLRAVRHHVIGVVTVEEAFNAAHYRELAVRAIEDIHARSKIPIVCGGSGMYMMVLLDGLFECGEAAPGLRERLKAQADQDGLDKLYQHLQKVDPAAALKIMPNDSRRILRALEVFETAGEPLSVLRQKRDGLWGKFDIRVFGIIRPREEIYARVEARVEQMFERGLVDEVRAILTRKITPSVARLIGVPEVRGFLEGGHDLGRAKYLMKLNTRHYVKRQLTWFRKDQRIQWMEWADELSSGSVAERIERAL